MAIVCQACRPVHAVDANLADCPLCANRWQWPVESQLP